MNTPAHMLLGAALFGRPGRARIVAGALVGAVLPDLSLYLLAGASLFLLKIPAPVVFGELYYSDLWQSIFAIDNSFFVWSALLGIAIWSKRRWAMALCGAALLHLALDFPLHHNDGRAHFWPLTSWVFESPLSYWDRHHHAQWVAPVEGVLAIGAMWALWRRRVPVWAIILCGVLLLCELWVLRQWLFVFSLP